MYNKTNKQYNTGTNKKQNNTKQEIIDKSKADAPSTQPVRQAAQRGQQKEKEWISSLSSPRMSWTLTN